MLTLHKIDIGHNGATNDIGPNIDTALEIIKQHFEPIFKQALDRLYQQHPIDGLDETVDAMSYSALNGGKRLRPALIYLTALCCGEKTIADNQKILDAAAIAIESIHCYSLIHDDLPAMDDDNLRRGQPTTHIKYSEATAILAGDALQTFAFECLCDDGIELPSLQRSLTLSLAKASGVNGMVGGQAVDLAAENKTILLEELIRMHRLKTGALIESAISMGAKIAQVNGATLKALQEYANNIGLAFQVRDDILDHTGDTQTLGKQAGADADANKTTFVSSLGLTPSIQYADELIKNAKTALETVEQANFDPRLLLQLADFIVNRKY